MNLHSQVKTNRCQPLVNLYWDLQNVSIQKSAHLLLSFAQTQGHLLAQNVYYNSQCQNQAQAKKPLSRLGFDCRDVPCPLKDSADHQLIAHCLKDIHSDRSPDIIILVSEMEIFAHWFAICKAWTKR